MRVLKYKVFAHGLSTVEMPTGSRLIAAGEQDHGLVVWALVDEKTELGQRQIVTIWTGEATGTWNRHIARYHANLGASRAYGRAKYHRHRAVVVGGQEKK